MPTLKKEKTKSSIRTIYLYLFALIGLVLITIGTVRIVDMALKAFVFTQAEQEENFYRNQPPFVPKTLSDIDTSEETITLSKAEKRELEQVVNEYNNWKNQEGQINFVVARRHQNASNSLAMILIGIPLYLYHWLTIKKETNQA